MFRYYSSLFFILTLLFSGCRQKGTDTAKDNFKENIKEIDHVVVVYMENHSFDNLWGQFEGANGISNAKRKNIIQLDQNDSVYEYLPEISRNSDFPTNLENDYFNIDQYVAADKKTSDLTHNYWNEIFQINEGKMNKYAAYNSSKGLAMGYYKTEDLPLYSLAKNNTLADNFFHSGFGNSYFNHVYFISSRPAEWSDAPSKMISEVDSAAGKIKKHGWVTEDGYVIGTVYPEEGPHPHKADTSKLLPPQTLPTIGDRLSDKEVSWAWYSAGWDDAVAAQNDSTVALYAYNHEPFTYFKNYGPGTVGRKKHLKDEKDFVEAAKKGSLPSVSFVKPGSEYDQHPGSGTVLKGGVHALKLINAVLDGPQADHALVILTYDENGGYWDHVAPPVIDRWGPGTRIPAVIIGPYAKKGYVDHTQYETVSILSFIEKRWNLEPLTERDKKANPLKNALEF